MTDNEALLTPEEVQQILGVTNETLQLWRRRKIGPPSVRLGHRTVRYARTDLDTWLELRKSA